MLSLLTGNRHRTPIGLDIGDTAIRAVQLRRSGDRYTLAAAARTDSAACGSPATGPSQISNPKSQISKGVQAALRQASFAGRLVVTALNPPEVEFHALDLPAAALRAPEREARQMVHWEIGRLTSESPDKVETRHWHLPTASGSAPNAIGVSAGREAVVHLVDACGAAGMVCSCVDTCATALCRFGRLLRPWPEDVLWGVLDVGARQARLLLCFGESPVLIRNTGTGGREWTQRIAEALQLSVGAAEIQKRTHGIAPTGRPFPSPGVHVPSPCVHAGRGDPPDPTLLKSQISNLKSQRGAWGTADPVRNEVGSLLLGALRSDLNDLAAEVKRSYEYVLSCYPGRHAGDLVLVGGGAGLRNLPEYLAGALGITVRRASSYLSESDCRLSYGIDDRHPLETFAAAVGLAIN
ncbi:MAG: pilus assembly protein PilM [Phycisphaerales bacterium]|nr:pilus assembly protein PilM [Phycisphaerales bacterium]